jgi:hypothetical protein
MAFSYSNRELWFRSQRNGSEGSARRAVGRRDRREGRECSFGMEGPDDGRALREDRRKEFPEYDSDCVVVVVGDSLHTPHAVSVSPVEFLNRGGGGVDVEGRLGRGSGQFVAERRARDRPSTSGGRCRSDRQKWYRTPRFVVGSPCWRLALASSAFVQSERSSCKQDSHTLETTATTTTLGESHAALASTESDDETAGLLPAPASAAGTTNKSSPFRGEGRSVCHDSHRSSEAETSVFADPALLLPSPLGVRSARRRRRPRRRRS